ncbi:MAG: MFS transporter [Frankiaceae bacterium]
MSGLLAGERAAARERSAAGARAGFWLVALAFAVTMAFSAIPTPLYVLYQERDGFGPAVVTVVFAVYAVGVIASLFLVGHLSDRLGRRRVLLPGIAAAMASGAVFLAWPSVPGLLVGRLICGVAVGMVTATATAWLTELHALVHPGASTGRAELVAVLTNVGGIGFGPLVAGLLAQYAPDPLHLPYWTWEGLLLVALLAVRVAPETVSPPPERPAYRPQRVSVPAGARGQFVAAGATGIVSFAVLGLFTSLAPGFLAGTLHHRSHALAGAVTFLVFAATGAGQLLLAPAPPRRQLVAGIGGLAGGIVLVTVAVWLPSLALLLAGGAVTGIGAGGAFRAAVSTVIGIAPAQTRGEALAGLFLASYVGLAVPVVGLGIATQALSLKDALLGFAAVLLALLAVVAKLLLGPGRT